MGCVLPLPFGKVTQLMNISGWVSGIPYRPTPTCLSVAEIFNKVRCLVHVLPVSSGCSFLSASFTRVVACGFFGQKTLNHLPMFIIL